jgi:hypothetical protein
MGFANRVTQEARTVINRIFSGSRCRVIREVHHPSGAVHRSTLGTIRYAMENLGRDLVMVDWDTGQATVVFPNDIELVEVDQAAVA